MSGVPQETPSEQDRCARGLKWNTVHDKALSWDNSDSAKWHPK